MKRAKYGASWDLEPSNNYDVEILGWDDIDGYRHDGVPRRRSKQVDGLILEVWKKGDREASRVFTVYTTDLPLSTDRWMNLIQLAAKRYHIPLEYDLDDAQYL